MTVVRSAILTVVLQHAEEASHLRRTRSVLVRAPHVRLLHLKRLDERISAHLDALSVAGGTGRELCIAALASPGAGELFAATIGALEANDYAALNKLLALAESLPAARPGLTSGFGWVSAVTLRGITRALLDSGTAFHRQVGLAACGMHLVDPGAALTAAIGDPDAALRARAYSVAGACGRLDVLHACRRAFSDADPNCRYQAARASLLLGDRSAAVVALNTLAEAPGCRQNGALGLLLQALGTPQAHTVLSARAQDPAMRRSLIRGAGIAGDSSYIPWLIKQMGEPMHARLAGESLSLITGLDIGDQGLEVESPPGGEATAGPNDDPADPNVAMDEDEGLPWPDPERIQRWWSANGGRFTDGTRYFMGTPVTREHCIAVLKNGYQRQRILAAHYLCLLEPGTPLFNTSAPAWRQQRLLAEMH